MPSRRDLGRPALMLAVALLAFPAVGSDKTEPDANKAALRTGFPRPRLNVLNGSSHPVKVFWLKSETERVPNGTIPPGQSLTLSTTLGHRFVLSAGADLPERIVTCEVPVQAYRFDPDDPAGVPAFYTRRVLANGYPIVASSQTSPYALKEAENLVNLMLARRPDLRTAMIQSGSRLCLMAHSEMTTDLPEFKWLGDPGRARQVADVTPKDYMDARARGLGGSSTDPYCTSAEENLLGYAGDPYSTECILIHEFAHNIHLRGLNNVDPTFDTRLQAAYDKAMSEGLWAGKYASVNHHEYFAEGVQSWFDNNRVNDHDHNHVNTRALLKEYDPRLAALCEEVFGSTELKYTRPETRLTGHLEGYDPAKAPQFIWPARLDLAHQRIREQATARSQAGSSNTQ